MIKTIIFDIGNVVLFFDHEKMVNQVAKILNLPFADVKRKFFEEEMLTNMELGIFNTEELLQLSSSRNELLNAFNEIFQENLTLTPVLHALKKQGKQLILLSNISEPHFNFAFQKYPTLHLFDTAILSYKIGHAKPSEEIFQAVLDAAGCAPYECFYTDDISLHIEAARRLAIDAEQFLSTEQLIKHLATRMIFI